MRYWAVIFVIALAGVMVLSSCSKSPPPLPPTPTPKSQLVPTPSPTHPPEIKEGLMILSHSTCVDTYGYFRIIGEVENIGNSSTEKNRVTVTFYDEQGILYLTGSGDCYLEIIEPGGRSPFEIVFPSRPEVKNYKLTTEWQVTNRQPNKEMVIHEVESEIDADGHYVVTGEITNTGEKVIDIAMVLGSFYDSTGTIVVVSFTIPDILPLSPGESSSFTFVLEPTLASQVDNFSLWVQGN